MHKTLLATAAALLAASLVMPAGAYHMDGAAVTVVPAALPLPLSDTDFVLPNPLLILCETTGPADLVNAQDPVTSLLVSPLFGIGGLCYSGSIPATGSATPPTGITKFDLCTKTTQQRGFPGLPAARPCNSPLNGPVVPGVVGNAVGTLNAWAFQAQLGVYNCDVAANQAFYYDETYSAMTWDAPVVGGNGHVAAFPNLLASVPSLLQSAIVPNLPSLDPLSVLVGSAETSAFAGIPAQASACGGSPQSGLANDGPTWVF